MKTILATGFEPFGGAPLNPSWEAVRLLPAEYGGAAIHTLCIPVVFGRGGEVLQKALEEIRPDFVFCTGVAGERTAVTPELVALNYRLASIPDNSGQCFSGQSIAPGGPAAYMTSLPVQTMVASLQEQSIPAALSLSAGAYVCNDLYYHLLSQEQALACRGCFIHLPPETVLPADAAAKALLACMATVL